jgi:transposase
MRRCAILCGPARRHLTIFGANASRCFPSLLRRSRIYTGGGHWTLAHRRWLAHQKFDPAAQQIVFQEGINAIEGAPQRLRRLEKQLALIAPEWSMAPAVEAYQTIRGASFLVAVTFDRNNTLMV